MTRPALSDDGASAVRKSVRRKGDVVCPHCGDWVPPELVARCVMRPPDGD